MANHLRDEISPYLLQHADNPVDWYSWGPEALERARREEKPIFLSIGYSTCHWCHVMAHESFEEPEIARLMNEDFISIKVDREERPDLDQVYMEAVQLISGHGGWPMSMFLTPEGKPFFGGTYWPARSRGGMPGFDQVLRAVVDAWKGRRDELRQQADKVAAVLSDHQQSAFSADSAELNDHLLIGAETAIARTFDSRYGGFGPAPKFPHAMGLRLLLRRWRRSGNPMLLEMVTATLDRMAAGGIYDHLGGGFHRYSVDARWQVPHFEKMLYDNALLAMCYAEAWQATGNAPYARVAMETLDYVLRDMTDPQGGFYSAEDADSEGEEGRFYLWTPEEVRAVLEPVAAKAFCYYYDVSEAGNFEGRNIPHVSKTLEQCAQVLHRDPDELETELADSRRALLAARSQRVRPGRDDKVLTSWNGLMIDAMAQAGHLLGVPRYGSAAVAAAEFLLERIRDRGGRLLHAWRHGLAKTNAFLDDYASFANALVTLYEIDGQRRWLNQAADLADVMLARFADQEHGGFFYTPDDHEPLLVRKKDVLDSSVPSSNSMAAAALLRLARLADQDQYRLEAERTLRGCAKAMEEMPTVMSQLLLTLDTYLHSESPLFA